MFLFNNPIICVVLICTIFSIPIFILMAKVEKLQHIVHEYSIEFFETRKKIDNLYGATKEMYHSESRNSDNIASLSSSVQYIVKDYKKSVDTKIYPTPQLSDMIGVTIREQIATEEMLSHNMRIPSPTSTTKIIENVIKTYPHVDTEYLTKRCMATIESDIMKAQQGG